MIREVKTMLAECTSIIIETTKISFTLSNLTITKLYCFPIIWTFEFDDSVRASSKGDTSKMNQTLELKLLDWKLPKRSRQAQWKRQVCESETESSSKDDSRSENNASRM